MNQLLAIGGLIGVTLLLVVGGSWLATRTGEPAKNATVVSLNGLHWHAKLTVEENGVALAIPANMGLGAVHNPIHTHDDEPGLIHMEFSGTVTTDDLRLGNFFRLWKKEIPGTARMTVNGEPNALLDEYLIQDGDVINIAY